MTPEQLDKVIKDLKRRICCLDKQIDEGGGGAGLLSKTVAQMQTLVGSFTPGQVYLVTDAPDIEGTSQILTTAIDADNLAQDATRLMFCPADYAVEVDGSGNSWIGVWSATKTANIDDLTIWGGQVWKNVNGNIGTAPDDVTLDAEWTLVPKSSFTNGEYILMEFGCMYDLANNWVEKQWDGNGNIFGISYYVNQNEYLFSFNPCDISDWNFITAGGDFYGNVTVGVWNNNKKFIALNTNSDGIYGNSISVFFNSNAGAIRNNVPTSGNRNINFNRNIGNIENNTNTGDIIGNYNSGAISGNSNTGKIEFNYNLGDISNNENSGEISNNWNADYIGSNVNNGDIKYNSNLGPISGSGIGVGDVYLNSNNGNILNNTNTGEIENNKNGGDIFGNSNDGQIRSNSNNGSVSSNSNTSEISFNANEGNISGNSNAGYIKNNTTDGDITGEVGGNVHYQKFSTLSLGGTQIVTADNDGILGVQAGVTDDVVIVGLVNTFTLSFVNGVYTGTVIT